MKSGAYSFLWCPRAESNHRHEDFQSSALPTELLGRSRRSRCKENGAKSQDVFIPSLKKNAFYPSGNSIFVSF